MRSILSAPFSLMKKHHVMTASLLHCGQQQGFFKCTGHLNTILFHNVLALTRLAKWNEKEFRAFIISNQNLHRAH